MMLCRRVFLGQGVLLPLVAAALLGAATIARAQDAAKDAAKEAAVKDFNAAAALQNEGLYPRAAEKWAAFIQQYPSDERLDRAHYYLGICRLHSKQYREAVQSFQTVLGKYPAFANADGAQYNLAMAQYQLAAESKKADDFKAAAAQFATVVTKYPTSKYSQKSAYLQGESLFSAGELPAAVEAYKKVVANPANNPLLADAYYALGTAQQALKQDAEAAATFQAFLANNALAGHELANEVRVRLGKSLFSQQKWEDARKAFEPLVAARKAESAEAAYWLGRTLLRLNKPQEALQVLDDAVKAYPTGEFAPYLRLARADALYELPDRRKETPALYEEFVKQYPDHALTPEALYFAAEGYLRAAPNAGGESAKAEQLYRQLVAKYPGHARALRAQLRIGWALHQQKKYDEAIKHLADIRGKLADPLDLAELHLLVGRSHSAAGRHKDALGAYDEALKAKPDWPRTDEVLLAAAESMRAIGDPQGAAERFGRLLAAYPQSGFRAAALYQLGEIAQEQKKYDDAVARYGEVVLQHAQSAFVPAANYGLAACWFAKGEYDKALAPLNAMLGAQTDAEIAARGRYLRGLIARRLKQLDAAATDLEAFLATKPAGSDALDARYELVLCRIGQGQLDQAKTALDALLKDKPDYPHADTMCYELGYALLQQKKSAEAAEAFRTLAEKLPGSPKAAEAFFHVGRWHEEAADAAAAEEQKAAALGKAAAAYAAGLAKAQAPDLREKLQYKLGDVQFRQKQFPQAAATLSAQIAEHPRGELAGPARFLAAESFLRQDQFDKALPLYVQVADAKVEKYHAQALYRAGTCAANLKNWPESQKHYEALLAQFPKFEQVGEARYGVAVALQNQNKPAEAKALCAQVAKETEGETGAKARFLLGQIAFAENKHLDAIEQYLLVAVNYPYPQWQGAARFEIGRCHLAMDQREKAIASLQIVVDKYPNHAKAAEAAKLLAELKK